MCELVNLNVEKWKLPQSFHMLLCLFTNRTPVDGKLLDSQKYELEKVCGNTSI